MAVEFGLRIDRYNRVSPSDSTDIFSQTTPISTSSATTSLGFQKNCFGLSKLKKNGVKFYNFL